MTTTVHPFLMFQGAVAEAAMTLYTSLFDDGAVLEITYYGAGGPGPEGSVVQAVFRIGGQTVRCSDSPVPHAFNFTPSSSLFVTCESRDQQDRLATELSQGGEWLMGLDNYGFSQRFGWLNDRFGVSWQLNLP
ncbi:MAG: 3-demethylubiquinone-9 3-methyltransferase [Caulobacter sp.]|nr:3-demethylubiquinone-9 3-methyltransferase [Caulobacter sp.]